MDGHERYEKILKPTRRPCTPQITPEVYWHEALLIAEGETSFQKQIILVIYLQSVRNSTVKIKNYFSWGDWWYHFGLVKLTSQPPYLQSMNLGIALDFFLETEAEFLHLQKLWPKFPEILTQAWKPKRSSFPRSVFKFLGFIHSGDKVRLIL